MRKTFLKIALCLALGTICSGCQTNRADNSLEKGFIDPTEQVQTSAYWYWIDGNISEEGAIKDLQAMKEAGINRVFIGFIGSQGIKTPYRTIQFYSDEWWKILHATLKKATELDIEVGLFNSPGWSQSGGPWIKDNQAMRYLASVKKQVKGGQKISIDLPKPGDDFQDVKVIAFPAPYSEKTLSSGKVRFPQKLDQPAHIDITSPESFTLRSILIYPSQKPIRTKAKLYAKSEGDYRLLTEFEIDRSNAALNVGFEPYAPVVISVPATEGKAFRLELEPNVAGNELAEVKLSSTPKVERYPEKSLAKMFQTPLPYWHEYQWRDQPVLDDSSLAIPQDKIMDISTCLKNERLEWDAPEGDWIVMRMGMRPTGVTNAPADPEATGLEVDKMSREHVEAHFEAYMGEIIRRIPEADRKCWKMVIQDSYETGGQNFTDDFLESFKERYGYDALPFLPVYQGYVVESQDRSDRFLWDMRRLVADRVAYDYVGGLRDVSHKYGLKTWLECYGHWGFPGEFLQYGGQSDEIGGEFWSFGDLGNIENRAASSCGHIYGKTRISAESFTSGGRPYECYPAQMKQRGDRFFSEGINNTLLHLYIQQPTDERVPGINAWFSSEFNRLNTWFSQMDLFTIYLKRVNFMLQQGLNVADVAYFIGEDTPKMTGITHPALPKGYQFDYINAEVLERDLSVKDGYLVLPHGTRYRLLVLPPQETMRPELLKKIQKLIEQGAVVMGPAPKRSPSLENYPQADVEVRKIAEELWSGDETYKKIGRGMLIKGEDIQAALDKINCPPDFRCAVEQPLLYSHRTLKGGEIYFISNQSKQTIKAFPEFRVQGLRPEWWDATTGKTRPLASYKETSTGIIVPISLAANESTFIVFREKISSFNLPVLVDFNCPSPKVVQSLNGPWKVELLNPFRQMKKEIDLPKLINLTQSEDPEVKYFSGTASYHSQFTLEQMPDSEKEVFFLDLGKVNVMAKVKINGKYVGGIWTSPYRVDVTEALIQGINQVEIEVVNTWCNRMIGDMNLPKEERRFWVINNAWKADSPLQPSGLEGPVTLQSVDIYLELPSEVIGKKEKENLEIKNSSQ